MTVRTRSPQPPVAPTSRAGRFPTAVGCCSARDGADAGANRRATHVIWEWVAKQQREVVWPPELASHAIVPPRA